jgi:tripartite ATP-independent transporter DctP family solute receptor
MKRQLILLGAASMALATTMPALAQQELKFGHVGEPGSLFEATANEFAKRANEKLGGKYKVIAFGSSQLGSDEQLLPKLKLGQVDFALPSTVMSSVSPKFGVFEMPYLIKDREHMKKVRDAILDKELQPAAKEKGYRILAVWENGFRHITNNLRPIVKPADLQGMKLRVPGGEWRVKMFRAYGANPSPMKFSEVFTALKTGVMDAQENPFVQIYSAKFQEVQKYLTLTGHVYTPAYCLVGEEHFSKLPPDVQKTLTDVAKGMQDWVYQQAAKADNELIVKLKAQMQVNEPDKEAFVAASKAIYDEFSTQVAGAKELIATAQKLR